MQYTENTTPFHRDLFLEHMRSAAQLLNAPYSVENARKVLAALDSELDRAPLGWKSNSRSNRQLYYNIFNHRDIDLLKLIRDGGLIPAAYFPDGQPAPIYSLIADDRADGADFNADGALCKVWTYTKMAPLDHLFARKHIPSSLRSFEPVLRSHGLATYFFMASDFEKNSMNVYVPWLPEQRNAEWVQSFAGQAGGVLSAAALHQVLVTSPFATGIGVTFDWSDERPLRACFYAACPTADLPTISEEARALREKLRTTLPTLRPEPSFYCSLSFGRAGEYVKFEKNYSGDVNHYIFSYYGLNPTDPHLAAGGSLG